VPISGSAPAFSTGHSALRQVLGPMDQKLLIIFDLLVLKKKHLPCCWSFSSSIFEQKKPPSCRDHLTTENVKATESLRIWRCRMDPNGRYVMSKNPWNLPMALPVEGPQTKKTSCGCGRSHPF